MRCWGRCRAAAPLFIKGVSECTKKKGGYTDAIQMEPYAGRAGL